MSPWNPQTPAAQSNARLALAATLLAPVLTLAPGGPALAHFQELIPSTDIVSAQDGRTLSLELRFTHPMARGPVMPMGEPVRFGVVGPKGLQDLKTTLKPLDPQGQRGWRAEYELDRPGDYCFFVEPAPYWEPAEGVMIVHYTKVVVDAFGDESGWDRDLGLPVEIEPLVRPYGLWTGNLFRGVVKRNGQPVPHATVEVEWRNDGSLTPPSDPYVTQTIKADASGVFAYGMPRAGWWGFAALLEGDRPMPGPDGREVPVEQGALIWVQTRDMR
jgi:cobalt/nickel transport protein